ncbi:MAG: hypothetical protein OEU36_13000 [Gammaproteobacteria bacterium]|nr:hypothetical protein [Gammaproteobacteria bacterium]
MKTCPNCKLDNPDSAMYCDCGYGFLTGTVVRKEASIVKAKTTIKKSVAIALVVMAILIVGSFAGEIGKLIGQSTTNRFFEGKREGELDQTLMQTAAQINKQLPTMVDANTRMDSTAGLNKTFRYHYTLVKYSVDDVDPKVLAQAMGSKIVNNVCSSKEMRAFVDSGVTVHYAYYGKLGKQITVISVSPEQCKGT